MNSNSKLLEKKLSILIYDLKLVQSAVVSTPNIPLKILLESCLMVRYYTSSFTYCRHKVTDHTSEFAQGIPSL